MRNFRNFWWLDAEIWAKNIKNTPKMGVFPHLRPPKFFFQKSGSVTFVPLWCTNFMQKIRKILGAVSEIFKDGPRTDYGLRTTDHWHRWLHRTPSDKPVSKIFVLHHFEYLSATYAQSWDGTNTKTSTIYRTITTPNWFSLLPSFGLVMSYQNRYGLTGFTWGWDGDLTKHHPL